MEKLLILKTMINRQFFTFLKNVFFFFIVRLYKECEHMLGKGRSYSERASERGDLFATQLIENIIHDHASKYNPYMLDGNAAISYRTASVALGKARVTGLSSLHRTNICSLTEKGNRLFINANLGAGPLTYQRQIVLRFGDFERKAAVLVSLIDMKVSVDFIFEKETGRNGFLLDFAINELNGFKLSVNGSSYFDWAINLFFSFWTLVLGRIVRNLLENELEQYILNRLPNYQFPVEGTSYRNETKFNNRHEGVQNNEASLSESFYTKQSHETPKWSRMSPIGKCSVFHGHNWTEYGTGKDFGSNSEIKTSRRFPETKKWTTEVNSFYLPAQSLDLCSGSLNNNSCNKVSKDKAEEKCDRISELSRKTREFFKWLKILTKKYDSINYITNSWSKEMTSKNCFDDCSFFDRNIPGELNDIDQVEYYSGESADSVTPSPEMGFENEQTFLICERLEKVKKSEMEDFSQRLQDSCRDQVGRASEVVNEKPVQYKSLEEIFSEIHERSCKRNVDGNAFDMEIKLPARFANCVSSPSTKLEPSQIDENILEPSSTGTLLNLTPNFDSQRRKAQIDYLEKMFNGKKRIERSKNSNKNQHISVERCNHCQYPEGNFSARNLDSMLCGTEMFQNECLISCTVDELEKHLKVSADASSRGYECEIEDPESIKSYRIEKRSRNQGVKTPEIQCISNPEDKVDGRNLFRSNIIYDSMRQKMIQDEKSFDLEADTEMVPTSLPFSEKHGNEVNEKILFKYVKVHTGEELNEDSQLKADEGYSADDSSNSEEFIYFDFPAESLGLCSGPLQKNSCKEVSKVETEGKCYPSVISRGALEISRPSKIIMGKLNSTNHITNSWSQESSLLEELTCLNEEDTECTNSMAEFSSIVGLKLNANSNKNSLEETSYLKPLHDLLQKEIIAKPRKLVSDVVLESDPEGNKYSGSIPISSYKNLEYQRDESICNEANQFLRKDSKTDLEVSLVKGDSPSLSVTKHSSFEYETYSESGCTSESEIGTSSETDNEPKL